MTPLNLGYARFSTDKQDFDVQVEALNRAATYHELHNLEVMEEPAVSGTLAFAERQTGAALLKKVETARRDGRDVTIVFPKVDRFGRDLVDIELSARRLEQLGARLIFLDCNVDTLQPIGRAFFQLCGIFAQLEVARLRERTRDKLQLKRANGELCGSLTYGWNVAYTFRDGHLLERTDRPLNRVERAAAEKQHGPILSQLVVDNPEEQKWIRHMAILHRGGASLAAIAKDLNSRRVPTKMGAQMLTLRCSEATPGAVRSETGKGFVVRKLSKGKWQVGNVEGVLTNATVQTWLQSSCGASPQTE